MQRPLVEVSFVGLKMSLDKKMSNIPLRDFGDTYSTPYFFTVVNSAMNFDFIEKREIKSWCRFMHHQVLRVVPFIVIVPLILSYCTCCPLIS